MIWCWFATARDGAVSVLDNLPKQQGSLASSLFHSGRQYSLKDLQGAQRWQESHNKLVELHRKWQEQR